MPVSDIAEAFVSVTDVKHYVYCPRLVYFDRVLHATPVFGSQQEEGKESEMRIERLSSNPIIRPHMLRIAAMRLLLSLLLMIT